MHPPQNIYMRLTGGLKWKNARTPQANGSVGLSRAILEKPSLV